MDEDQPTQLADSTTATPPAAPDARPTLLFENQIGSTRLIRRVGTGGMGEVWLARHELLGRDVAIKFLHSAAMDSNDPGFRAFIQGAKVAASVDHPALNKVFHADVANAVPYLVLEFLDGFSLAEIVARSGPLPAAMVRAIIEPICDAVAELHHRDLLHRDIKPANMMLTTSGRAVLTDFGLARAGPVSALRSNNGNVAGTPRYMAPEMFDGTVSARTDVYAIGMTVYYLLCGKPAFSGSFEELKIQHKTVAVNSEPLRDAGVGEGLIDVVARATSKDILFRPKTARHLLEAFRAAFDAAGISTASRETLAQLLNGRSTAATDQLPSATTGTGSAPMTIAEFAARKREQRHKAEQEIPAEIDAPDPVAPPQGKTSERWRIGIATIGAAAIGSILGFLLMAGFGLAISAIYDALLPVSAATGHRSLIFHLIFGIAITVLFITVWLIILGGSTFAYRKFRGKLLPKAGANTRCGWCQHELRGITTPVCSECGHRIGDRGPDQWGQVPPARRRPRRIRTWLLLPACVFAVYFPLGIIAPLCLLVVRYLKHPDTMDLHFVRQLMLSFTVAGEFTGMLAALFYYEAVLRFRMKYFGRAWCRICRSELLELEKPACPTCGASI